MVPPSTGDITNGEWRDYRRLVVSELERLDDKNKEQDLAIYKLEKDIMFLKLKSGFWGFLAGSVPTLIIIIMYMVFKLK